jgi:hypothetical protein
LAADAAENGRPQSKPSGCGFVPGFVTRGDDHQQVVDFWGRPECCQGMPEDRLAIEKGILLGCRAAKSASPAGGNDQGGATGHRLLITLAEGLRTRGACLLSRERLLLAQLLCTAQVA